MSKLLINSFINCKELNIDFQMKKNLEFICNNYFSHKFDLLGSGPVTVRYGVKGRYYKSSFNNNIKYKNPIWLLNIVKLNDFIKNYKYIKYISKNYIPIDWHTDYKSGFRFNARKYDTKDKCLNSIDKIRQVEIKVPWELGRLYHLPRLAYLALFEPKYLNLAINEFKNEVLDFIITNPYEKTIQWSSAMDTAIRSVNLLIAYDILKQLDDKNILDEHFTIIFTKLIRQHGKFIMKHMEYYEKKSSNHYLSNLVGLAFIAAYLPSDEDTDAWLVFATQELISQTREQFYEEGSNFEGSTSYHCLSSEFVIMVTALIMGVLNTNRKKTFINFNKEKIDRLKCFKQQKYDVNSELFFPQWYWDRIAGMGLFIKSITKPNNEIVQVGDNDSGRLLKLSPVGNIVKYDDLLKKYKNLPKLDETLCFEENDNVRLGLLTEISTIVSNLDVDMKMISSFDLEKTLIASLCKNKNIISKYEFNQTTRTEKIIMNDLYYNKSKIFLFDKTLPNLSQNMLIQNWKDFGICIIKSPRMFMEITVDTTKNAKILGHTHNDKLSIDLMVDNKNILLDPGTYVYTSNAKYRNYFRSVRAHNTIIVENDEEQNEFKGPFNMRIGCKAYISIEKPNEIVLWSNYRDIVHIRKIMILDNSIIIDDSCNRKFRVNYLNKMYSNGYGKLLNHNK